MQLKETFILKRRDSTAHFKCEDADLAGGEGDLNIADFLSQFLFDELTLLVVKLRLHCRSHVHKSRNDEAAENPFTGKQSIGQEFELLSIKSIMLY